MKPQAYTEFQPLKKVLVGTSYDMKFLESLDIPFTPTTKRLMSYLLDETEEDYQKLISTLKQLNVEVVRPSKDGYENKWTGRLTGAQLMNPRDNQIVIDNKILWGYFKSESGKGFSKTLIDYKNHFLLDPKFEGLVCASIVRLGEHIIVDNNDWANTDSHVKRLKQYFEPLGYKIIYNKTHDYKFKNNVSHSDAVFSILKPGLILHASVNTDYSETIFKNWDLIRADRITSSIHFKKFLDTKNNYIKECSYAFEDKKYDDDRWYQFLNSWFSNVMGYSQETYFDVNCLVIDEENVIFSSYNAEIFRQLEKYNINPIVCPFRHRLFWDGGTHCITLDLNREGSRERYL